VCCRYARENLALPDAYNGPNPFITRILIQLITEDDMWITRVALPFRFTEDSMEFAWNVWIFNNHGMDSVPEEGVSRLLSTQMGERRGHYTRYGLGFILEHGRVRYSAICLLACSFFLPFLNTLRPVYAGL
jgi:hypothetical protein